MPLLPGPFMIERMRDHPYRTNKSQGKLTKGKVALGCWHKKVPVQIARHQNARLHSYGSRDCYENQTHDSLDLLGSCRY